MNNDLNYVIASPVKNEVKYIENTIKSVVNQTIKPAEWLIVSDQSNDGTDEIVEKYAKEYPFITLCKYVYDGDSPLVSAKKTYAARHALKNTKYPDHDFFCGMDADVTFPENFFEELMKRANSDEKIGVVGGFIDHVWPDGSTGPYFNTPHSIGGPLQFFKRKCYEEIGGWLPYGMEDGLAVASARMKGWKTIAYSDLKVLHHKPAGIPGRPLIKAKFNLGRTEYLNGDHFIYHIVRSFRYIFWKPFLIGPFLRIFGYLKAYFKGEKITTPEPLRSYLRKEQMRKLNVFKKFS